MRPYVIGKFCTHTPNFMISLNGHTKRGDIISVCSFIREECWVRIITHYSVLIKSLILELFCSFLCVHLWNVCCPRVRFCIMSWPTPIFQAHVALIPTTVLQSHYFLCQSVTREIHIGHRQYIHEKWYCIKEKIWVQILRYYSFTYIIICRIVNR